MFACNIKYDDQIPFFMLILYSGTVFLQFVWFFMPDWVLKEGSNF